MSPESGAAGWLAFAGQDLRMAELGIGEEDALIGPALFHCQQAAEKALKAAIVSAGEIAPRTHDLTALLDRLRVVDPRFERHRGAARLLTPYAVRARYPDVDEAYTREEAEAALDAAREIVEAVREVHG